MAYDVFSQPNQPTVPISLFADAATSGTNVGHATPTWLTSALRGASAGAQKGQETVLRSQNIEANQQTIESNQIALDRAEANKDVLTQAQREDALSRTEEARARTQQALNTQQVAPLAREAEESKLNTAIQKDALAQTINTQGIEFNKIMDTGDTAQRYEAVNRGRFEAYLAANPKLRESATQSLMLSPDLDTAVPGGRQAMMEWETRKTVASEYDKDAAVRMTTFQGAKKTLYDSSSAKTLAGKVGVPIEKVPDNIKLIEEGRYQLDGQNVKLDPLTGEPVELPKWDSTGKYIALRKDPKTGKIINGNILHLGITNEDHNAIVNYSTARNAVDGTDRTKLQDEAVNNLREKQKAAQATTQGGRATSTEEVPVIKDNPLAGTDLTPAEAKAVSVNMVSVNSDTLKAIAPSLQKIKNISKRVVSGEGTRVSQLEERASTIKDTAGIIIRKELEDPEIKKLYTQEQVDEYNKLVDDQFYHWTPTVAASTIARKIGVPNLLNEDLGKPFKVSTPEELYAATRYKIIARQLERTADEFSQIEQDNKSAKLRKMIGTDSGVARLDQYRSKWSL